MTVKPIEGTFAFRQKIRIPRDAQPLAVRREVNRPVLYFLVDPSRPEVDREVVMLQSFQSSAEPPGTFVGVVEYETYKATLPYFVFLGPEIAGSEKEGETGHAARN